MSTVENASSELDDLGRQMGERIATLSKFRDAVSDADKAVSAAQGERDAAAKEYNAKIQEVRTEGLLTDSLLARFGHEIPKKRRGRKPAAK